MKNMNSNIVGIHGFWWVLIIAIVVLAVLIIIKYGIEKSRNKKNIETIKKQVLKGELSKEEFKVIEKIINQ